MCKVLGHVWNNEFICTRCKYKGRYEEFPQKLIDEDGIPHRVVMDYMRRKYMHMLPPSQKLFNEKEKRED